MVKGGLIFMCFGKLFEHADCTWFLFIILVILLLDE